MEHRGLGLRTTSPLLLSSLYFAAHEQLQEAFEIKAGSRWMPFFRRRTYPGDCINLQRWHTQDIHKKSCCTNTRPWCNDPLNPTLPKRCPLQLNRPNSLGLLIAHCCPTSAAKGSASGACSARTAQQRLLCCGLKKTTLPLLQGALALLLPLPPPICPSFIDS